MTKLLSIGNKLIVEAYQKEGLKSTVQGGFAMVQQKVAVKGLKVLVDGKVALGNSVQDIPAGSIAHIREEYLHTAPWAQKILESAEIGQPFIIVDMNYVEFISDEA